MRPALRACTSALSHPARRCRPRAILVSARLSQRYQSDDTSTQAPSPFEGYYIDLMDAPLRSIHPATRTQPTPPPADELPKTDAEEKLAKARVVFGSRLAGPAERRAEIVKASTNVAGIMVPPRPEEPDNCCMSGCVNCVWDRYRDEMEEWAEKSAEAKAVLARRKGKLESVGTLGSMGMSMDDDGGGSEASWAGADGSDEGGSDLFADIPVGIREFMKTEKRLKARHAKEVSTAG